MLLRAIDTRYGRMAVPDVENDIVSRFLREYGEWAELEVEFLAQIVPEGGAVADIGAFVGTFGLSLQRRKSLTSVCFVEANPEIVPLLRKNVKRNAVTQCKVVGALIAPDDFHLQHASRDVHNIGSASFVGQRSDPNFVRIPMPDRRMSLGELDRTHGPFDLIKLDVEGMELTILAGEAGIVERENTAIWLECNEQEASLDLAQHLLDHGRKLYYFAYPSFTPDNFKGAQTPIFPFAHEAGLLAAPAHAECVSTIDGKGCIFRAIASREDLRAVLWHTPRWAPREWWNLPTEEIVALASHQLSGTEFKNFLNSEAQTQALLAERDAALRDLQAQRAEHEAALRDFQAQLVDAETRLADAEARLAEREAAWQQRDAALADALTGFRRTEETLRRAKSWTEQLAADRLALLRTERDLRLEAEAALRAKRIEAEQALRAQRIEAEEALRAQRVEAEEALRAQRIEAEEALRMERYARDEAAAALAAERELRGEAERSLSAIMTSTSWRATKPLRSSLTKLPRLRRLLSRIGKRVIHIRAMWRRA